MRQTISRTNNLSRWPLYSLLAPWPGALGLLALAPPALAAQQGTITYIHSINVDLELPPELAMMAGEMPSAMSRDMLLHFDPSASLMVPAPIGKSENGNKKVEVMELAMFAEFAMAMSMGGMNIGGKLTNTEAPAAASYTDLADGRIVETHEFMGRTFRVLDERPEYGWRLTGEQALHLGYMVIKATAEHDSTTIEAWFTPQIPVGAGPGPYGGLPGMILVLSADDGHIKYFATEIALGDLGEGMLEKPEEGREMSKEEYDKVVAEKMEEMRKMMGGRIGGVGGGR